MNFHDFKEHGNIFSLLFCPHFLEKWEEIHKSHVYIDKERVGPFILHKKIASGGAGSVYEVSFCCSSQKFAGKIISIHNILSDFVPKEIAIQRTLLHPNIVQFYDVFKVTRKNRIKYLLLMELVSGMDLCFWLQYKEQFYLRNYLEENKNIEQTKIETNNNNNNNNNHLSQKLKLKLQEKNPFDPNSFLPLLPAPIEFFREKLFIFNKVLLTIQYLWKKKIVHRDIKLENILYDEKLKQVKLCDFGLSTYVSNKNKILTDTSGSIDFSAPEVIKGCSKGEPSTVWSLGVLLYTLMLGIYPFYDKKENILLKKIKAGRYQQYDLSKCYQFFSFSQKIEVSSFLSLIKPEDKEEKEEEEQKEEKNQNFQSFIIKLNYQFYDLIKQMLCLNPNHRISLDSIRLHDFFFITYPFFYTNLPPAELFSTQINELMIKNPQNDAQNKNKIHSPSIIQQHFFPSMVSISSCVVQDDNHNYYNLIDKWILINEKKRSKSFPMLFFPYKTPTTTSPKSIQQNQHNHYYNIHLNIENLNVNEKNRIADDMKFHFDIIFTIWIFLHGRLGLQNHTHNKFLSSQELKKDLIRISFMCKHDNFEEALLYRQIKFIYYYTINILKKSIDEMYPWRCKKCSIPFFPLSLSHSSNSSFSCCIL